MGHWGTGISSNDTFMEVYETYFHYYNYNLSIENIKERLESDFADTIANEQTSNDYWFALAKALWECKALDSHTFAKVKNIIHDKLDLKVWKELEASEKDLKAREKALNKFWMLLSSERDKPKARKKIILRSGFYEKGTCIAIKFTDGNYGGLLVLEREVETENGENYIAATNIYSPAMPNINDFNLAKILTARKEDTIGKTGYFWEYFIVFAIEAKGRRQNKNIDDSILIVGQIPVKATFGKYFVDGMQYLNDWIQMIEVTEHAVAKIREGEKENIKATVREWINARAHRRTPPGEA